MASLAAGLFAFFATAISASVYMPIEPSSAAETVTPLNMVNNEPSVSVSASTVDFGRISKVYGERVIRTASNTVTVNAPLYGYELYISTSNDSNNLIRYGTTGSSGTEIIPAAPTISTTNPAALNDDTWGFAVKKRNTTVNSGSEDVPAAANFDTSYPTGDDSNPDSKFSAVPTQDNLILIAERNSNAENVPTDVYFGVSIKDASIGIYQGTITYTVIGKEPTTHIAILKLTPGISKITIGDTECNATNATDSTDESDPEGTKQCEVTLTYGYSYSLTATLEDRYSFTNWTLGNANGAFSDNSMAATAFTAGKGDTTITPIADSRRTRTIALNSNGATTNGSETTTATYEETMLGSITNPQRSYSLSSFDISYNNASNATVSSTSTLTSTYSLTGWYKEAEAINKIASNATTPVLQPNTDYTDADGKWTSESDQTLYAGWDSSDSSSAKVTLPTITKTGYICGWTTSTNATAISYGSGASIIPTANMVLHGVCTANTYTITLNGNGATTSGSTSTVATYGSTTLGAITLPQRKYTISGFTADGLNASGATVSSTSTLTSTYTFNGWYEDSGTTNMIASSATTPALQASTTYTDSNSQWTSTSAQTLYAGWSGQSKTLPTISKTGYTCGWATSKTASKSYNSGASITPTSNLTLYGSCTANTYAITLNGNGATATGSTSATATYGSSSLTSITNPTRSYIVSGFDTNYNNASGASVGNSTSSTTIYSHTDNINDSGTASGTYANNLAINKTVSISSASALDIDLYYSTESSWDYLYIFQGIYSGSVTKNMSAGQLYTYNGGAKTTKDAANHVTITIPGNTATFSFYSDGSQTYYGYYAVVRASSSRASIYTFNGWYSSSSGGTQIITAGGALTASNGYTNSSKQWTSTSGLTVYANWTSQSVTLPTISKSGYSCGWTTSTSTSTISYSSGGSFAPSSNTTLHGVCKISSYTQTTYIRYQNANGTWGSYSKTESKSVNYGNSYSWSRAADTTYQAASVSTYTVTGAKTNYVDIYRNKYTVDVNPMLNGDAGGGVGYSGFSFDVYIDGTLVADNVQDWASWDQGLSATDGGYLRYGQVVRVVGNSVSGYTLSNGDTSYTITSTTTISAPSWTSRSYTLYFNANGGSVGTSSKTVTYNSTYGDLPTPTRSGYVFTGGMTDSSSNFYYKYYADAYADLYNAFGYNEESLWQHYVNNGKNEGRKTNSNQRMAGDTYTTVGNSTLYAGWRYYNPTIQNYTKSMCQSEASYGNVTTTDQRDNNTYTVRYINGNCWMTQNLRYLGDSGSASNSMTIKSATTNVSSNKTLSYTALNSGTSYDVAKIHNSGNTTNGVWYNFAAASAGTITGSSNSANATQDICPKNWRLPTGGYNASSSEQQALDDAIGSSPAVYNPATGGYYRYGTPSLTDIGRWWSSTAVSATGRYDLVYSGSSIYTSTMARDDGLFVRCIHS